jgi:hypothetical protein
MDKKKTELIPEFIACKVYVYQLLNLKNEESSLYAIIFNIKQTIQDIQNIKKCQL